MSVPVEARLLTPGERTAVVSHLAREARANLLLLDLAVRLGAPPAAGELPTEIAVAYRGSTIAGVAALRPSVVIDIGCEEEAIEALVPHLDALGVGLVKSPLPVVDQLWERLALRRPRRAVLDRLETAYALGAEEAALGELRSGELRSGERVRPATRGDLDALVVAARESLREEQRPDPFAGDVRGFRRWVRGRVERARVVECDGRVVSVAYADVRLREGWLIQGVYTWPDVRQRGFARSGVSALGHEAFAAGAEHVQLAVVEGNRSARLLYEGLGFKPFASLRTIHFS